MSAASGSSCQYRTHLHRIASQPTAPGRCRVVQDSLLDSGQRQWGHSCTCRIAPTVTNTPYELVYRINPDIEHIRTFRCVVKAGEGGEVKCTNQIWEVGQSNGEQNGQNSDVRPCKGTGSRWMKGLCNECDIQIILLVLYSPSSNSVTTKGTWVMSHGLGLPP